jgi:CheY-like chemotaxis protein
MDTRRTILVMLVDDNPEFFNLVNLYLSKSEDAKFEVIWKNNGQDALAEAERNPKIDVVLMDYFMPGLNGLEVTRALQKVGPSIPVIFLTVNRDMNLAVEVMKLGVHDYLVKEEISTPILPKTILSVVQKQILKSEMAELEIRKKRLEAMQEIIVGITNELTAPLREMKSTVGTLASKEQPEKVARYLSIIKDNLERIEATMRKLQNLREDRTVQYIKDIQMIDLG